MEEYITIAKDYTTVEAIITTSVSKEAAIYEAGKKMKCSSIVECTKPEIAFKKAKDFQKDKCGTTESKPYISQEDSTVKVGMLYPREGDEEKALISAALMKMQETNSRHIIAGFLPDTAIHGDCYYDGPCDAVF